MDLTLVPVSGGVLAVRASADAEPPLVCLHGFTLHGGMFAELAAHLDRPVLAPDLPGHGRTAVAPVDLESTLDALAAWLGTGPGRVPVLGYSQGGRIALHLAARRPDLVAALVLVSSGTGLRGGDQSERRRRDEKLAVEIERNGVAVFLDRWLADPIIGTTRLDAGAAAGDRRLREENTAPGLAAALRGLGQGVVPAVDAAVLDVPSLWIAGGEDERYAALAREAAAAAHGDAEIIPGSGHNLIAERPATVADVVTRFLRMIL
jgi:2-succinyl-6-hydroxy-2,4-cyclohexadiene-1-carboxylate synthase